MPALFDWPCPGAGTFPSKDGYMTDLLTRRAVVAGMGVLGLGMLAGCSPARGLEFKYGKNMS
ncbi:MAG TPA: SCO family protein, partial [Pseudomonas sp.]|nr:SCO family protein [Pseudomonas sp.]